MRLRRVLLLCRHVGPAYPDRRQLVASDAPREDLFFSCDVVESPRITISHQGNGKWPSFMPDDQHLARGALIYEAPSFRDGDGEDFAIVTAGCRIRRVHKVFSSRPEDRQNIVQASRLDRGDQSRDGRVRRRKRRLSHVGGGRGRRRPRQRRAGQRHRAETTGTEPGIGHRRRPPPRALPLLRCPRELAARSDRPLEYPEKASERVPLRSPLARSPWPLPRDS